MNEQFTELEKQNIEAFCANKAMFEAVKKCVLSGIYTHGTVGRNYTPDPTQNAAFHLAALAVTNPIPNEQLGEHLRGMWAGVNALKNGFDNLENIKSKKEKKVESPYNEAV